MCSRTFSYVPEHTCVFQNALIHSRSEFFHRRVTEWFINLTVSGLQTTTKACFLPTESFHQTSWHTNYPNFRTFAPGAPERKPKTSLRTSAFLPYSVFPVSICLTSPEHPITQCSTRWQCLSTGQSGLETAVTPPMIEVIEVSHCYRVLCCVWNVYVAIGDGEFSVCRL